MTPRNEMDPVTNSIYRQKSRNPIQPISHLPTGTISFNNARTSRRRLGIAIAGVVATAAGVGYTITQTQRKSPAFAPQYYESKPIPPAAAPKESPHYWKPIEFRPDGSVHFTDNPEIVEARLDSGETIFAQRVLGPTYEYTAHRINATTPAINLGEIKPSINGTPVTGGEHLRHVQKNGQPVLDPEGRPIHYKASQARIQPQTPQKQG